MSQNDFKTSETMQPQEASPMKHPMSVLGIDIAKRLFHVVGMNERGQIVLRKRLARNALMPFIATLPKPRHHFVYTSADASRLC
jgi:hypothetical protein